MQRNRKKRTEHINGTENILSKGCTTTSVQNYDQKSSGRPDSGAPYILEDSWHITYPSSNYRPMRSSSEGTSV
ncbi:hypothetical protein TNCV_830391 [Trichonephila clavipes]|nr:hypothetical protein TNCV_830391 [Trichonephila clavipes]